MDYLEEDWLIALPYKPWSACLHNNCLLYWMKVWLLRWMTLSKASFRSSSGSPHPTFWSCPSAPAPLRPCRCIGRSLDGHNSRLVSKNIPDFLLPWKVGTLERSELTSMTISMTFDIIFLLDDFFSDALLLYFIQPTKEQKRTWLLRISSLT